MEATVTEPIGRSPVVRSAVRQWDLLLAITVQNLKVWYQGTVFSYLWWVARPLALGMVLYFALGRVLKIEVEGANFSVFLLTGLFPWFWFAGSLQQSASSFTGNSGLIKKVQFPLLVLPLSTVLFNTLQFLLAIPILTVFVLVSGDSPELTWVLGIPLLLALQLLLIIGLGTLVASITVFFRDLEPMLEVVLLLMFYTSAVIFPLELVPDGFRPLVQVSPITTLLEGWRGLLLDGALPGFELWPAIAGTAVALVLGLVTFHLTERHFADAL